MTWWFLPRYMDQPVKNMRYYGIKIEILWCELYWQNWADWNFSQFYIIDDVLMQTFGPIEAERKPWIKLQFEPELGKKNEKSENYFADAG